MKRRTGGSTAEPSPARPKIFALLALALVAIASSALISVGPLLAGRREVREVGRDDLALMHASKLARGLTDFQVFVEPHMSNLARATPADLASGAILSQAVPTLSKTTVDDLLMLERPQTAAALTSATTAYANSVSGLSVLAPGTPSLKVFVAIADERAAFTRTWSIVATADAELTATRDLDLRQGSSYLNSGRVAVLIVDVGAAVAAVGAALVLDRRAHRREHSAHSSAERRSYEKLLQGALEMAKSESAVYAIVGEGLRQAVPEMRAELLVADSSRAHFHETLNAQVAGSEHNGCGVDSPLDCPATTRGHTLVFASSRTLDACPYLRGRPSGECSAACVPVSVGGKTVGVMHATGTEGVLPRTRDVEFLELTARRASERISMLRAFAKSETQAQSDPLTGLWNRRTLENRVNDLQRDRIPYTIAYGDLDHFKVLNDTHGHDAGDRALRLFSRVLTGAIRPDDTAARYGGEEFVIVLPNCAIDTAVGVLERVRENLAIAITSGTVPPFTVSFGLASSTDASTFEEVLQTADHALLDAKAAGRDRVEIAALRLAEHDGQTEWAGLRS